MNFKVNGIGANGGAGKVFIPPVGRQYGFIVSNIKWDELDTYLQEIGVNLENVSNDTLQMLTELINEFGEDEFKRRLIDLGGEPNDPGLAGAETFYDEQYLGLLKLRLELGKEEYARRHDELQTRVAELQECLDEPLE